MDYTMIYYITLLQRKTLQQLTLIPSMNRLLAQLDGKFYLFCLLIMYLFFNGVLVYSLNTLNCTYKLSNTQ